ncbi:MAG: dihydroorotase [Alphaproteobacteria bacterium]
MFDLIVRGGIAATPNGILPADVGVRDGLIAEIGDLTSADAAKIVEAKGLHVLPGVIDTQVHFREPGFEYKEDIETGTKAAVLGGVTAVFEMPNTKPSTITPEDLADKIARARNRAWCDIAFYIGAAAENVDRLAEYERLPGCAGIKVFMGSSTGSLLVDSDEMVGRVLANGRRRVAVHSEDEARLRERRALVEKPDADVSLHPVWRDEEVALRATTRLMRLARAAGRRVHVLHVTSASEIELLQANRDIATVEVTPQHLTLAAPECYRRLGTLAQMNPPIRDSRHRDALWRAVKQGIVDVIGSDHAPHTREEKAAAYPNTPAGMPGVQTLLPLLLDHVSRGNLTLERLVDLTSAGAARIFAIAGKGRIAAGYDADLTLVDLKRTATITDDWIASRCKWTPFAGTKVTGWPVATIVRGRIVVRDGDLCGPPSGRLVRFQETLGSHG